MDDTTDPGQSRNNEHSDDEDDETELFKGMLRENQNSNLYREGNSDSRVVAFKTKIRANKTGKRKKRDKKSSNSRTQRQRVEDLLFKGFQIGRDSGEEAVMFIAMYLPCKSRGVCKRLGFGPKADSMAQTGFVREFFDKWEQLCIKKNCDQKKELQKAKSVEAQRSIENPNEDQNEIQSSNNSNDITEIPLVVVETGALMNVTGAQSIIEDPNEDVS